MAKKKVIYIGGVWDLYHIGHLNVLLKAKQLGDILIVGVSTSKLIYSYKKMKPIIPFNQRIKLIRNLKCVDMAIKQTIFNDIRVLKKYRVDAIVTGEDWRDKKVKSLEWMKKHGEVIYLPHTKGISSSKIKEKIIKKSYKIIKAQIVRNREK